MSFMNAKKLMANPNNFCAAISSYDWQNVSPGILKKLGKITSSESFNFDVIKKRSCAAAGLCVWVLSIEKLAKHAQKQGPLLAQKQFLTNELVRLN